MFLPYIFTLEDEGGDFKDHRYLKAFPGSSRRLFNTKKEEWLCGIPLFNTVVGKDWVKRRESVIRSIDYSSCRSRETNAFISTTGMGSNAARCSLMWRKAGRSSLLWVHMPKFQYVRNNSCFQLTKNSTNKINRDFPFTAAGFTKH